MQNQRLAWGGAAVLLLLVVGVLWFTTAQPVQVLPRIRIAPGYSLRGADGRMVTSEDQRGKLTLYTFAYTRCGAECQPIYDSLRAVGAQANAGPARSPQLDLVILTVDPANDPPATLAAAQAGAWRWLTGSDAWMKNVIGAGFDVPYQPQADGSVFFSPRFVLVDGNGIIRGTYDGARLDPKRFESHLKVLYKEIEQATGPARLAYEAAHFFACYPH